MANRSSMGSLIAIAGFTLITAMGGLYLGFVAPRSASHGKPAPIVPDQGAILYDMHSIFSPPDRVRLDWKDVAGAVGYRITVMTPSDDSLFVSPPLTTNSWVIPNDPAHPLQPQTTYHWKVTVTRASGVETSDAASFATQ
ncbi:MAG TPA: hypothetical protein VFD83_03115 [Candidatus Polarisedimenticolia bacterium]|nr:hypothetical protein [Candidatus Polarisedimenticolia bacterium]